MDKEMKRTYQVPFIKVVSFKVENGFQGPTYVGRPDADPQELGAEALPVQNGGWYQGY